MCLITPLGKISISIDGKEIDYTFKKINPDRLCNDVDGRYSIIVPFTPNGKNHMYHLEMKINKRTGDDMEIDDRWFVSIKNIEETIKHDGSPIYG